MKRATSNKELSSSLSSGASFSEKRFAFYLQKYYDIEENTRTPKLEGKELDIFIPSLNVGIEYDGRNWHDIKDDALKNNLCQKAGIELIRVREEGMDDVEGVMNLHVVHYDPQSYNEAIKQLLIYLLTKDDRKVDLDIDVVRDDTEIQEFYINWQMTNSFGSLHQDLAKEWDYDKNKGLKPEQYAEYSNFKVWWKCELGHSWKSAIVQRVIFGTGCPVCSGRKVLKGFNDLATVHPESKEYWDYDKNVKGPECYTEFSEKKVYWKCSKGHEWSGYIGNFSKRISKTKFICPECPRPLVKKNVKTVSELKPVFLNEWAYDLNTQVSPEDVSMGSSVMVWWRCKQGHIWKSNISNRSHGQGCPICSSNQLQTGFNDLEKKFPTIAKEWDTEKNGVSANTIFPGTVKKYWWLCPKGHSYQASPNKRTSDGTGCPFCSNHKLLAGFNDLATTNPELLSEWDYGKNKDVSPDSISKGSSKKVWWLCPYGHSYYSRIDNRAILQRGCPICKGKTVLPGFNDLATTFPEIAAQWHPELNDSLKPSDVTPHTRKNAWWICKEGHVWQSSVCNRTRGHGCPICANTKRGRSRKNIEF